MQLLLLALVNLAVGLLIGWSGIAGFLLPMFYAGYMNLPVPASLTLSFSAFAVSGIIGSIGYYKKGNLPIRATLPLAGGSLLGAVPGILLNAFIPAGAVKLLLYGVVLASGISILLRERRASGQSMPACENTGVSLPQQGRPTQRASVMAALGFGTALVCALSGAGGPVLVMPLLVLLGVEVRSAIGVALFDSIFIALPSVVGYGLRADLASLLPLLAVACLAHAAGVFLGSQSCHIIRQRPLKIGVSLFSIAIALYMIVVLLL